MAIPSSFINELLARCDIVDIIGKHITLRKRGTNHVACCPFHQEKTPSFTVSETKQVYHCFGCGAGGNAIGFIMAYENLNFPEAIEHLAQQQGMAVPHEQTHTSQQQTGLQKLYSLTEKIAEFYQQQLRKHPAAKAAVNYLKQRGLSGNIAKQFGIGFAPPEWDSLLKAFLQQQEELMACGMLSHNDKQRYYDKFRGRIMFPIHSNRGQIIGFGGRTIENELPKYLNSPETIIFHKSKELYGLYEARKHTPQLNRLLIVEGYMDVIALAQYGITYAVATLGTATTNEHIKILFRQVQELVFCFDGDQAGQKAAWRALELLLPHMEDGRQVKFLLLPEEDDPDSLIRKIGVERFTDRINQALPFSEFFFNRLSEQADLQSTDSKAKFAAQASEYIKKLPTNIFQRMLMEKLAQIVQLDVNTIQNLTRLPSTKRSAPVSSPIPTAKVLHNLSVSPIRRAVALLIQHPELIHSVQEFSFEPSKLQGADILQKLIQTLQSNPALTTNTLLELWRTDPAAPYMHKLALWEHHIPPEGLVNELHDALKRIQLTSYEQQIDELLVKSKQEGLTHEEKTHLQGLIFKSSHINNS